ncbi:DnaD domain protein [Christensenellaceae bacterium OttesenSCG-928-L17]|nr:DnaD domain protein [Christensenellaceae bacterium OttesenSCG-928-L17]
MEATPVDNLFLLEYMPRANHTQLRVYLFGLMQCRYPGFAELSIADELACSAQDVVDAFAYWQREGLVRILSVEPLDIEYIAPAQRVAQPVLSPGRHHSLVQAVQALFAPRALKPAELRRIYDWVEVFGLESGAVMELVSYCLNRKGANVSITYLDAVARNWANEGVRTAQDAIDHAAAYEARTGGVSLVLQQMGLTRSPTKNELEIYKKWTDEWRFSREAILAACPALLSADRPNFAYLDGVLNRLHQEGVVEAPKIEERFLAQAHQAKTAQELFLKMGISRAARLNEREELQGYVNAGLTMEILLFAAEQAAERDRPLPYFRKLIKEYQAQNVQQLAQAKEIAEAYAQKQPPAKKVHDSMNYPQKHYSTEELQHIFITFDNEEA